MTAILHGEADMIGWTALRKPCGSPFRLNHARGGSMSNRSIRDEIMFHFPLS